MGLAAGIASAVISFFGVYAGVFLSRIAPEELKSGKRYAIILRDIAMLLMIIILAKDIFSIYLAAPIAILAFGLMYSVRKIKRYSQVSFAALAIPFAFSRGYSFPEIASLIFIYGALITIIDSEAYVKKNRLTRKVPHLLGEATRKYFYFLAIAIALLLFSLF